MSTPKIKVYRIPETGYTQENDSDIQSVSSDELIPIVKKNLSPLSLEPLVGVKLRKDARLVKPSSSTTKMFVEMDQSALSSTTTTSGSATTTTITGTMISNPVCCDGWILGRGNLKVWVLKKSSEELSYSSYSKESTISNVTNTNGWYSIEDKYWDYVVEKKKVYVGSDGISYLYTTDIPGNVTVSSIIQSDYITFKIGDMLTKSQKFFDGDDISYEEGDYVRIVSPTDSDLVSENQICVEYSTFSELTDTELSTSLSTTLCAPFGDIYNGNKTGRKVAYTSGTEDIDWSSCNYFEGNYIYKKRVSPLRVKVAKDSTETTTDFNSDATISSGTFSIDITDNWNLDEEFYPTLMQRITANGNTIFIPLEEGTQYNKAVVVDTTGTKKIKYTFVTKYYTYTDSSSTTVIKYPTEVFVFYNLKGDSVDDAFDFEYDYSEFSDDDYLCSGNKGKLVLNTSNGTKFGSNQFHIKSDKMVVREGFGYDASNGNIKLHCKDENALWFDISGITNISINFSIDIYSGTSKICSCDISGYSDTNKYVVLTKTTSGTTTSWSAALQSSDPGDAATSVDFPLNEIMIAYHYHISMYGQKTDDENPDCIGYRVPCYEKVKSSTLFVSSYPCWVRGHLNNDLDVFVGNSEYSGTTQTGDNANGIYPNYVEDGWYGLYAEGAVQFNEEQDTLNYYDIYNFYVSSNSTMDVSWNDVAGAIKPNYMLNPVAYVQLLYSVVKANVARYDSIYVAQRARMSNYSVANDYFHYALLDDDDFSSAKDKRWLTRNDGNTRRMYESGEDIFPIVESAGEGSLEAASVFSSISVEDSGNYFAPNLSSDRIVSVLMKVGSGSTHTGVAICLNHSLTESNVVSSYVSSDYDSVILMKFEENSLQCAIADKSDLFNTTDLTWHIMKDFDSEYTGSIDLTEGIYGDFEDYGDAISFVASDGDLKRCRYYNPAWYYDVYFEVECYHYSGIDVSAVEVAIYRVKK